MKTLKILLLPVVLTLLVNSVAFAKNITGTWRGYYASNHVPLADITMKLNQVGNKFAGTISNSEGVSGKITGTVNKDKFRFTIKTTTPGCSGTFKGKAIISDNTDTIATLFTGSDCLGTHRGGGYVEKQ